MIHEPKILTFINTHDEMLKSVKMESSYMAVRRTDQQGTPTFEQLVFDEEYAILFRSLFFDARTAIISACSAYLMESVNDTFNDEDFSDNKDFILQLCLPCTFKDQMTGSIGIKIKEYLTAYIMYRWLETKLPQEAMTYKIRSEQYLMDIKIYLGMRNCAIHRRGSHL